MSIVLTLNLPDAAASFLSRPVTLVAAPELAGARPELLRDEDETEAEFAARQRGFNTLLGLP